MIGNDWDEKLKLIEESEGFKNFMSLVDYEYICKTIYPPRNYIFNALKFNKGLLKFSFFSSMQYL